jgi:hypothetical protein
MHCLTIAPGNFAEQKMPLTFFMTDKLRMEVRCDLATLLKQVNGVQE